MKEFENIIIATINSLGTRPILGTFISLMSTLFGMILNTTGYTDSGIPEGIKDIFQMIAWICTIAVSILTIVGLIKKNNPIKKKNRGKTKNNS
jgi:hypothetical protein